MISNLDNEQTIINRCASVSQNLMLQIPAPFQSIVIRVYYITRERPVGYTRQIESRLARSSPLALTSGDVWSSFADKRWHSTVNDRQKSSRTSFVCARITVCWFSPNVKCTPSDFDRKPGPSCLHVCLGVVVRFRISSPISRKSSNGAKEVKGERSAIFLRGHV